MASPESVPVADGAVRVAVDAVMLVTVPTAVVSRCLQRTLDDLATAPRDHGHPCERGM